LPFCRFVRASQPRRAEPERHGQLSDQSVLVGVAQHLVRVLGVPERGTIPAHFDQGVGEPCDDRSVEARITQRPRDLTGALESRHRGLEGASGELRFGQLAEQPYSAYRMSSRRTFKGKRVLLHRAGEMVRRKVKVADGLVLIGRAARRACLKLSLIGGDRSLHYPNPLYLGDA
jgi:hypothetical protein